MSKDTLTREMSAKADGISVGIKVRYDADIQAQPVTGQCRKLLNWVENRDQIELRLPDADKVTVANAEIRVDQPGDSDEIGSCAIDFPLPDSNREAMLELFARMERGERFAVTFHSLGQPDEDAPADIEEDVEPEEKESAHVN